MENFLWFREYRVNWLTDWLTDWLTEWMNEWKNEWCRIVLEQLIVAQLHKKFPAFYGIRSFIAAFARDRLWSVSWARWIQSVPCSQTSSQCSPLSVADQVSHLWTCFICKHRLKVDSCMMNTVTIFYLWLLKLAEDPYAAAKDSMWLLLRQQAHNKNRH